MTTHAVPSRALLSAGWARYEVYPCCLLLGQHAGGLDDRTWWGICVVDTRTAVRFAPLPAREPRAEREQLVVAVVLLTLLALATWIRGGGLAR
mgnify:CR=1 FL=1